MKKLFKEMTRAEKRRVKYAIIMQYYKDKKLATQFRDVSNAKIFQELGIKIESDKTYNPDKQYLEAKRTRRREVDYAKWAVELEKEKERLRKLPKSKRPKDNFLERSPRVKIKKEDWIRWSRAEGRDDPDYMPEFPLKLIEYLNKTKNADIREKFGFAYAYYRYVEGMTDEEIEGLINWDDKKGVIVYTVASLMEGENNT